MYKSLLGKKILVASWGQAGGKGRDVGSWWQGHGSLSFLQQMVRMGKF
jgi:hypothetical protein